MCSVQQTDHVEAQKGATVLPVKKEELGDGFRSDHTNTQLPWTVLRPQREALQNNSNTLTTEQHSTTVILSDLIRTRFQKWTILFQESMKMWNKDRLSSCFLNFTQSSDLNLVTSLYRFPQNRMLHLVVRCKYTQAEIHTKNWNTPAPNCFWWKSNISWTQTLRESDQRSLSGGYDRVASIKRAGLDRELKCASQLINWLKIDPDCDRTLMKISQRCSLEVKQLLSQSPWLCLWGKRMSDIYLSGGDVVPPGWGLAGDLSHLQLIRRLVNQRVERTHSDNPRQVKAAHLDANAHLDTQSQGTVKSKESN